MNRRIPVILQMAVFLVAATLLLLLFDVLVIYGWPG